MSSENRVITATTNHKPAQLAAVRVAQYNLDDQGQTIGLGHPRTQDRALKSRTVLEIRGQLAPNDTLDHQ